jgi:hypothetical protein
VLGLVTAPMMGLVLLLIVRVMLEAVICVSVTWPRVPPLTRCRMAHKGDRDE